MIELGFAPEVADLPLHSESELEDLSRSMRENGYLPNFPIVVHGGLIYDGRNRYLASKASGTEPVIEECETKEQALIIAESSYLQRVYTIDQKIQVKAHFANLKHGQQASRGSVPNLSTTESLAEESGVSVAKMKKAVAVKNAVEDGKVSSEFRDRVLRGEDTNNAAYEAINKLNDYAASILPNADKEQRTALTNELSKEATKLAEENGISIKRAVDVIAGGKTVGNGQHTIGDNDSEWYTPVMYVEAARVVLGTIDVDPATCDYAQKRVKASTFFTEEMDGTKMPWLGQVWLNPPYGKETKTKAGCTTFINKLMKEVGIGNAKGYLVLVNTSNGTEWYEKMCDHCSAMGLSRDRIQFDKHPDAVEDKKDQNTKGQTLFYLGDDINRFYEEFHHWFNISVPLNSRNLHLIKPFLDQNADA